jgi:hypothetical protein
MRTNNLNEIKKSYLIQNNLNNKTSINIFTRLNVLIVLFLVSSYNLHSQNSAFVVTEMNSYLNSSNNLTAKSTLLNKVDLVNKENIQNLTTKVQSTMNFYNGEVKVYGDKPTKLYTNLSSIPQLENSIILKNNVEIIVIKLTSSEELNSNLDLNQLSGFKNLKYIYFNTNFDTTPDNIANLVKNYNEKYSIFYRTIKGDN